MTDSVLSNLQFKLTGVLLSTGTSVKVSNDLERNQVITATNCSVVLHNKANTIRERMKCSFSGGTMTILSRGLDQSQSATPTPALQYQWGVNTEGYITVLAPDFVSSNQANTWTGKQAFTDVDVTGTLNMGAVGDLNVLGKSNPQPNFATTIARDLVYTSPVNGDKCTVDGVDYSYNGSTVQWEAKGVSTPLPDATTVAKGKARLATAAEVIAGVVTDAIVTPETLAAKPAPSSFIITSDYPLGEPITALANSCVFKETVPTFAQATTAQNIGDIAGNTRVSFPAIGTGVASNSLKLSLAKNGSPTAFLRVRIEADNAGNPSGTLVNANATKDIDPAGLTTSLADTTVLMGDTVANDHGVTLNVNETSQTVYKGVKFTLTSQVGAVSVDKVAGCTATKAYLYDLAGNLLTSATFSTNTATLNYNGLVNGQSYYIMAGSDGSSYTSVKQTGASAYPYTAGRLNYVGGIEKSQNITDNTSFNWTSGQVPDSSIYYTIIPNKDIYLSNVVHTYNVSDSGATYYTGCKIQTSAGVDIETGSMSSGTATFSGNTKLSSGVSYRLYFSGPNGSVHNGYDSIISSSNNNITLTSIVGKGYINTIAINSNSYISGTNVYNITSISTLDTILIPSGQKVHTVVSAVGGVVNASNYYKIGYSTNDTSTRSLKLWNGSTWILGDTNSLNNGLLISSYYTPGTYRVNDGYETSGGYSDTHIAMPTSGSWETTGAKTIAVNSYSTIALAASISTSGYSGSGSGNAGIALRRDANNYVRMYISVNSNTGVKTIVGEIQVAGSSLYSVSLVDIDRRCKILKSGNTYSFYYHNGTSWVQLGVSTSNTFSGNPYIHYFGNTTYARSNAYIDNPAVSNTDFSGLYPIESGAKFPYISSTLFHNTVLSLTDSDFSYKVDLYGIATATGAVGSYPKIYLPVDGAVVPNFTGMTSGDIEYLSGTPGAISNIAGTNKVQVGKSFSSTRLENRKKMTNVSITVGASPFTWQNTTGKSVQYYVVGGTVNPIAISKDNSTFVTQSTATGYIGTVAPNDYLKITYTVVPTLTYSDL